MDRQLNIFHKIDKTFEIGITIRIRNKKQLGKFNLSSKLYK